MSSYKTRFKIYMEPTTVKNKSDNNTNVGKTWGLNPKMIYWTKLL